MIIHQLKAGTKKKSRQPQCELALRGPETKGCPGPSQKFLCLHHRTAQDAARNAGTQTKTIGKLAVNGAFVAARRLTPKIMQNFAAREASVALCAL